jgi:hypothetical protein
MVGMTMVWLTLRWNIFTVAFLLNSYRKVAAYSVFWLNLSSLSYSLDWILVEWV